MHLKICAIICIPIQLKLPFNEEQQTIVDTLLDMFIEGKVVNLQADEPLCKVDLIDLHKADLIDLSTVCPSEEVCELRETAAAS